MFQGRLHPYFTHFNEQEVFAGRCLYNCLVDLKKVPRDKRWARLQRLGVPPHLQQAIKALYTAVYAKVRINGDTHGEITSDIGVKQ